MEKLEKLGEKESQGLRSLGMLVPQAPGLERERWRTSGQKQPRHWEEQREEEAGAGMADSQGLS